jgi:hypothetical protein
MARPKEAADAADERIGPTTREIAESYFADVFWPLTRVILWIAFRDIDRLVEYGLQAAIEAIAAAALYRPKRLHNARPRQALLQALQRGQLAAIRDGAELRPEVWAAATWQHWPPSLRFRRKDVLRCWPRAKQTTAGQESAAAEALAGHLNNNPQMTRAAAKNWCQSKGFIISQRGFQSRVWPEARHNAGLPRLGAPGRKRKMSR